MSEVQDTFLDPERAAGGAVQLTQAGQDLVSSFGRIAAKIDGLNAAKPWGDDAPGKEFNKNYLEGGEEAPATVVLTAGKAVADRIGQLGPDVREAILGTVEMDDLVGKWFGGNEK